MIKLWMDGWMDGMTFSKGNRYELRKSVNTPNTTHLHPQARTDVGLAVSVDGAIEDLKRDLDG